MVKRNAGFSLMETIMTVAILGIVVMVAPTIINQTVKFFILGKVRLELQREARAAMYVMTREIRQAQSSTIVIDQINGQPYYSRLRFTKIQGAAVTMAQQGSSLLLTEGVVVSTMSKNLAFLSFAFPRSDDMTILSVSLTLQEQIYDGAYKALHMASEKVRVMN
jgi:prepilin-type N-terminal cleavage/methylation domain-containing protein